MSSPFFSVFIPAKGRPALLDDAIQSVLRQSFTNVEIVVSNNGAAQDLKEIVNRYLHDSRVRYVEHVQTLNMPEHWEKVSRVLTGEYVLVLTDRSVMKVDALARLHAAIVQNDRIDVVSWPWDLYYDHLGVLLPFQRPADQQGGDQLLDAKSELISFGNGVSAYPYSLPRGLNSAVKRSFIDAMRADYQTVFRTINPDYSFGYLCLLRSQQYLYLQDPLFISQGLTVSNGGNSYEGDAARYFDTLNLSRCFVHVPIHHPMVQNGIHEDYLAMAALTGNTEIYQAWNRKNYYFECITELYAKKASKILAPAKLALLEQTIYAALDNEDAALKDEVMAGMTLRRKLKFYGFAAIKRLMGRNIETVRKYMLLKRKGGELRPSALDAAGFRGKP